MLNIHLTYPLLYMHKVNALNDRIKEVDADIVRTKDEMHYMEARVAVAKHIRDLKVSPSVPPSAASRWLQTRNSRPGM